MTDNLNIKILSDITVFNKYAKYIPELGRRETFEELCIRNYRMHIKKYPMLSDEIKSVYENFVMTKKILPSMRSMQFAGKPIELSPNRIFNCCFTAVDDYRAFSEIMFLLLGGSGVGYSVQQHHVAKLPPVKKPIRNRRFVVGDSIEGWADAVKALVSAYLISKPLPKFDFSDIRPKGAALITSGGKAPGPEPLKDCIHNLQKILDRKKDGEQLTSLEVHDMICWIADSVLAGGIRRAALISLFNIDDQEMLSCKAGKWYELNPQRARANNSAVIMRHRVKKNDFMKLWGKIKASGSGEPGLVLSNNSEYGTNPCFSGDTKVAIADGINITLTLKEMAKSGKDYPVYCLNNNGELCVKTMRNTQITRGNTQLYKIILDDGQIIKATANHKFRLQSGEWVRVDEMAAGTSLWSMTKYQGKFHKGIQFYTFLKSKDFTKSEHQLIAEFTNNMLVNENQVVHHINFTKQSASFRFWDDRVEAVSMYNHKVVSVEIDVVEDVYCGSVDDFANFFIGGQESLTNSNKTSYHFVNVQNCGEIALRNSQFCNLVEINLSNISSQEDLNERSRAAAFIGTLQAGYTDFHYLRDVWKKTTEKDALLGVSGTGIASEAYLKCNLTEAVEIIKEENIKIAKIIDIKPAARYTCVKPAGTTSLVLGSSSGIHAWFDEYYIRRIKLGKNEALYKYVSDKMPSLIEDDYFKPHLDAFIKIPVAAPKGAIISSQETAITLLERIKYFSENWIKPGHVSGDNMHNVSATVYIKDNEWDEVANWMWQNRDCYNGLSVLPYNDNTYIQAPHEAITKEVYDKMTKQLRELDLTEIKEEQDNTQVSEELACAGGACDVKF